MEFFKTTMPQSRKAGFYLGCLDSSVFIDFDKVENDRISLVRISFDGFGCCNIEGKAKPLNQEYSALFLTEFRKEKLNQESIKGLVLEAIRLNKDYIWNDALEEYNLV